MKQQDLCLDPFDPPFLDAFLVRLTPLRSQKQMDLDVLIGQHWLSLLVAPEFCIHVALIRAGEDPQAPGSVVDIDAIVDETGQSEVDAETQYAPV
jgi:hypothetical protein